MAIPICRWDEKLCCGYIRLMPHAMVMVLCLRLFLQLWPAYNTHIFGWEKVSRAMAGEIQSVEAEAAARKVDRQYREDQTRKEAALKRSQVILYSVMKDFVPRDSSVRPLSDSQFSHISYSFEAMKRRHNHLERCCSRLACFVNTGNCQLHASVIHQ